MKRCAFIFLCLCWNTLAQAEIAPVALETAPIEQDNKASIQRGAQWFSKVCMACHTLIYLRYDPIAKAAGITLSRMPLNVTTWPNGIKPPDLSLEADVRGIDWIYTYLHSFYIDPKTVTGFNNLVFPNTGMPDILAPFQGLQVLAKDIPQDQGQLSHPLQWYDVVELQKQGTMAPAEFDQMVADVVNFLAYAANPDREQQHSLGKWVIGFLFIGFVLCYLLKKEYWKDVHKK